MDNLWEAASFDLPSWDDKLLENKDKDSNLTKKVFYSGPRKYLKSLKRSCKKLNIPIDSKKF